MQEQCLSQIEDEFDKGDRSLFKILKEVGGKRGVPVRTLYAWWDHFQEWGEYPFETKERKKRLKRLRSELSVTKKVSIEIISSIQEIIIDHPEYYLDEIQYDLCKTLGVFLSISTIWKVLRDKLGYSMQVCYHAAAQRNEGHRKLYLDALNILVKHPRQLIYIDETHKDKNAARRRKAWGRRNSGGVGLRRWFHNTVRYTMIAALDINGFIPSSIELVRRDQISSEGAAGTVDADYFETWVEHHLCPSLGDYSKGAPRSIVVMDNASTHMDGRVEEMIRATGAILVYTAPFSPDLNPIELAFNIYKAHLKRNMNHFETNWFQTHVNALSKINRDICIKEFQRCRVPMSDTFATNSKEDDIAFLLSLDLLNDA